MSIFKSKKELMQVIREAYIEGLPVEVISSSIGRAVSASFTKVSNEDVVMCHSITIALCEALERLYMNEEDKEIHRYSCRVSNWLKSKEEHRYKEFFTSMKEHYREQIFKALVIHESMN